MIDGRLCASLFHTSIRGERCVNASIRGSATSFSSHFPTKSASVRNLVVCIIKKYHNNVCRAIIDFKLACEKLRIAADYELCFMKGLALGFAIRIHCGAIGKSHIAGVNYP